jgi:hypothetical protein
VLRVVLLDDVLQYSAGFPKYEAGVWIFDGRSTAIGVEIGKGLLLDEGMVERVDVVGQAEFFEKEDRFPRVRARGWKRVNVGWWRRGMGAHGSCEL